HPRSRAGIDDHDDAVPLEAELGALAWLRADRVGGEREGVLEPGHGLPRAQRGGVAPPDPLAGIEQGGLQPAGSSADGLHRDGVAAAADDVGRLLGGGGRREEQEQQSGDAHADLHGCHIPTPTRIAKVRFRTASVGPRSPRLWKYRACTWSSVRPRRTSNPAPPVAPRSNHSGCSASTSGQASWNTPTDGSRSSASHPIRNPGTTPAKANGRKRRARS